jgi:hypothetical protein
MAQIGCKQKKKKKKKKKGLLSTSLDGLSYWQSPVSLTRALARQ